MQRKIVSEVEWACIFINVSVAALVIMLHSLFTYPSFYIAASFVLILTSSVMFFSKAVKKYHVVLAVTFYSVTFVYYAFLAYALSFVVGK